MNSTSPAPSPTLPGRYRPLFWGVGAFLVTFLVGPTMLPETIGTYTPDLLLRFLTASLAGLTAGAAALMYRHRARPVGRWSLAAVGLVTCLVPAWLYVDSLSTYWIYGDDWEYIASSRTFPRAVENLFTPHNVHVVPVWRLVSWVVVASAGSLANLPDQMAMASFTCLVVAMLMAGRFAARESGSATIGLATTVILGTSALMQSAGAWFSAAQALGAAIGVLMTLWYLQGWRRHGGAVRLTLAVLSTLIAGWSWTVGYAAGPVGAAYLWADGRKRCRWAALLILLSSGLLGGLTLKVAGRAIQEQSTISFHGRKTTDAISPSSGLFHTIQAIPERLILGNLGIVGEVNLQQATALVAALALIWYATRRGRGPITPLEAAGLTLVVTSYALEWTFRGYLPFSSLRGFVPWYETIPQVGYALFVAGWWSAIRRSGRPIPRRPEATRWGEVLLVLTLQVVLATLAVPRVNELFLDSLRPMLTSEVERFPIPRLKRLWGNYVAADRAERQRRMLARLDRAEVIARTKGIGRDALRVAQGRTLWPDPPVIDDADMLDLPRAGRITDPAEIRALLGPAFAVETEARPIWVNPAEPWPPPKEY